MSICPHPRFQRLRACLFSWVCVLSIPLIGQLGLPSPPPENGKVASSASDRIGPLALHDVGIDQILELLERWTGKTLLRPQTLPAATLSLTLKNEVVRQEGVRAIETLLSLNGIAVTPLDDNFLKVTPANAAKSEAPELITGSPLALPPSGRLASKLFKLKFLRVTEFIPQITGLLSSANGAPSVFEKSNATLITDSVTNLQRVETLMLELDHADTNGLDPKFYTLNHAKASDVVSKLRTMMTGATQAMLGSITSYSADDRTNQIVLFCDPQQYAVFDKLIAQLDVKSGQDMRNEVILLKHASAKDVTTILTQLVSGQASAARNTGEDPSRGRGKVGNAAEPVPAPVVGAGAVVTLPGLKLEPTMQFSAGLTILAEDRSNSIVVAGTTDDIRLINDLVGKIDVLLAQVRIEVVIAEVTLDNNNTTGISALGLKVEGDKLTGFSGSLPGLTVLNGTVTRADPTAEKPIVVSGPWDLAAQIALTTTPRKAHTNILSVPNIITTHNREGKIFVGEQRPVISSYLNDGTSSGGTGSTTGTGYRSTIDSKDIGIQLIVKPLIGNDGSVQLEIKQEVSDILGETLIDGNPQPRIGRRSTESFISAKSGEVIVLGGLQRTSQSLSTSRLGPIPIIGDLLGARSWEKSRTDLVFFLRPTVLTNTEQDNAPAMEQVEKFPKPQRQDVKRALEGVSAAGAHSR